MKLRYSPRAKADITAIHAYIAEHNPKAAKSVIRRIRAVCNLLSRYPGLGRKTDILRVSVFPAAPYPYLIYYTRTPKDVIMLHIRHGARSDPERKDLSS